VKEGGEGSGGCGAMGKAKKGDREEGRVCEFERDDVRAVRGWSASEDRVRAGKGGVIEA